MINLILLDKLERAPLGARSFSPNLFGVDDALAGSIISGGASLLGGLLGVGSTSSANRTNLQIARENNIASQKLWQQEADFTREMWNQQNAYNTPSEQRKRYEAAGINPAFAMGNINSGSATSVSTPSHQPLQGANYRPADFGFLGDSVNGALNQFANVSRLENDLKIGAANARRAEAEANIAHTNSVYADARALAELGLLQANAYKADEERASSRNERYMRQAAFNDIVSNYKLQNENLSTQMGLADAQIAIMKVQEAAEQLRLKNMPREMALNLALISKKIATEESIQGVNYQTARNLIQSNIESQARTFGIRIQNRQSERMAELLYRNALREDTYNQYESQMSNSSLGKFIREGEYVLKRLNPLSGFIKSFK